MFFDHVVDTKNPDDDTSTLVVLLGLYLLVLFLVSIFLVVRHLFNAVDGHPLLAPLYAAIFSWWLIVQKLIYHAHSDRPLWLRSRTKMPKRKRRACSFMGATSCLAACGFRARAAPGERESCKRRQSPCIRSLA